MKHYIFVGKETPSYAEPFEKLLEKSSSTPPNIPIGYDDPCGLYFTSGTTGQPKPILLTHKNMVCACITENAHHYQTKRITLSSSLPFIIPGQRCIGLEASLSVEKLPS